MSMIPCPGCGLPRVEDQLATPCPVCAAGPVPSAAPRPAARAAAPDPTAGLPADASELHRPPAAPPGGGPRWLPWAAVFLLGVGAGFGGAVGFRAAFPPAPPQTASAGTSDPRPLPDLPPPSHAVEVAPPPHEPAPPGGPEPAPDPRAAAVTQPDGRVTFHLDNAEAFIVPTSAKKGVNYVLKGTVKKLSLSGMDAGDVVDASGLTAETVTVGGRIAGGAVLKVRAPDGSITVTGQIDERAVVDLHAPGGT